MNSPLCIELFAGLHGWGEGATAEGFCVIGFDIVDMCVTLGRARPRGIDLVLQDVLTLHGSQFRDAALIVASPPCQAYSYRAMPWKRAKGLPPPSNDLFEACFRIQREACEAAGRHIPMVVENVKGAQPWVGRAKWHYGSFYLWGDVPALMPTVRHHAKVSGLNWGGSDKPGYKAKAFNSTAEKRMREAIKNNGGSWFNLGSPGQKETNRNPVHDRELTGLKGLEGKSWIRNRECDPRPSHGNSPARKAASAQIAKIPLPLAQHIARVYHPREQAA